MSLEEKVGQVFIFTFVSLQQAQNDLRFHPGGFIRIYGDCLTAAKQHADLQVAAKIPLIFGADFESGIGSTVHGATNMVGNMCLGASGDEQMAYECARAIAEEAAAIGVNMNYAPVMDVNVNEANPIINVRAFGGDPELVARMGCAFIRGSRDGGVLTCAKHFPGHGDTQTDSHTSLGVVGCSRERLHAVELFPFRAAIGAGVDAIMSAHLQIPAIEPDSIPSTMSRRIMQDMLRGELGFEGVAISDALEMGGVTHTFRVEEAVVRAFSAGCDQLLMPVDNRRSVNALLGALREGRIAEQRLDEAVARILAMKEKAGLFEEHPRGLPELPDLLDSPDHYATALEAALAGITLVRDNAGILPVTQGKRLAVITFSNSEDSRAYFFEPKTLAEHCAPYVADVQSVNCGMLNERMIQEFNVIERARQAAASADVVVLGAFVKVVINRGKIGLDARQSEFVRELLSAGKPVVLVSLGSPYLVQEFPEAWTYICAYSGSEAVQHAAALLICGKAAFRGKLPVSITLPASDPAAMEKG